MAKTTIDKWKTKKWFEIVAPQLFQERIIGHTIGANPQSVVGRIVEVSLSDATGNPHIKQQKVKLRFRIKEVKGERAITIFLGHKITQDFERSLVRRRMSKIYVNKEVTTKDNKKIRVKSFLLTAKEINKSRKSALSKKYSEFLITEAKTKKLDDLINEILSNKLSVKSKKVLQQIYPIKQSIVQKTELILKPENKGVESSKQ